jgi:hypothetical protein
LEGGDSNVVSIDVEGDLAGIEEGGSAMTWQYRIDILGNRQHRRCQSRSRTNGSRSRALTRTFS